MTTTGNPVQPAREAGDRAEIRFGRANYCAAVQLARTCSGAAARPASGSAVPPAGGMAWIPGGTFSMGSADFYPEEGPVHRASVAGFWMDEHPVTVAEYWRFAQATGYLSVAQRPPDPADYPGADPALLVPGSLVFGVPRARSACMMSGTGGPTFRAPAGSTPRDRAVA